MIVFFRSKSWSARALKWSSQPSDARRPFPFRVAAGHRAAPMERHGTTDAAQWSDPKVARRSAAEFPPFALVQRSFPAVSQSPPPQKKTKMKMKTLLERRQTRREETFVKENWFFSFFVWPVFWRVPLLQVAFQYFFLLGAAVAR